MSDSDNQVNSSLVYTKRTLIPIEPIRIDKATNINELDNCVLLIQNDNLRRYCNELEKENNSYKLEINEFKERNKKLNDIIRVLRCVIKQYSEDMKYLMKCNNLKENIEDGLILHESTYSFIEKLSQTSCESIDNYEELKNYFDDSLKSIKIILSNINSDDKNNISNNDDINSNTVINTDMNGLKLNLTKCEYLKFRELITEYTFVRDKYDSSRAEINKMTNLYEELSCELNRVYHRYDVLATRYQNEKVSKSIKQSEEIELVEETVPTVNNNNVNTANEESLIAEINTYKTLMDSRSNEMEELHKKYVELVKEQKLKELNEQMEDISPITLNNNKNISLQYTIDELIKQNMIQKEQIEIYRDVISNIMKENINHLNAVKINMNDFRNEVKDIITGLNKDLYDMRVEYYKNEYHYKKKIKYMNQCSYVNIDLYNEAISDNLRLRNMNLDSYRSIINNDTTSSEVHNLMEPILRELDDLTRLYEECNERNISLSNQIKELENTNLSHFTEVVKLQHANNILKEEKQLLNKELQVMKSNKYKNHLEEINTLKLKIDSTSNEFINYIKDCKNKENLLDIERNKNNELFKNYITVSNLLDATKSKLECYQQEIVKLRGDIEDEVFKNKRNQEQLSIYKSKYEHADKNQYGAATDKILSEEARILKNKLRCSSCNIRQKDAISTKCYHLFCFDCLLTNYNSRQRKCPRCSQSFGQHDFHKIYF